MAQSFQVEEEQLEENATKCHEEAVHLCPMEVLDQGNAGRGRCGHGVVAIGAIRGTRSDTSDYILQRPDLASPSVCWLNVLSLDDYNVRPTSDVHNHVEHSKMPRFLEENGERIKRVQI